jgi:hypothetical protein
MNCPTARPDYISGQMNSYADWVESILARSGPLERDLEWLRAENQRGRDVTLRFCEYATVADMDRAIDDAYAVPYDKRRYRRGNAVRIADDIVAALRHYVTRLRSVSRKYCGDESAADALHAHVSGRGCFPMAGSVASTAAPIDGYGASSVAAGLVGDTGPLRWATGTATKARNRHLEQARVDLRELGGTFYFYRSIDGS